MKPFSRSILAAGLFTTLLAAPAWPAADANTITEPKDNPNAAPTGASEADPAAMKRWQDARFGMFIHWGPASLTGTEISWSRGAQIPVEEYEKLYKRFNPVKFNADEWVSIAKAAGMKCLVLTTKHHDGFCLWDTKLTDYNIMNGPFKRDVVKELAEACKKQGLPFGCYYSTCDWRHPDFPLTGRGGAIEKPTSNIDRYTDYLNGQVKELLTNYGPLITLWFDVPQKFDAKRGQSVIDKARAIQPDILVNNRTGAPGDYRTAEQRVGGFTRDRPWETNMTICDQWAWKADDNMKSLKQCVQTLISSNGGDGNLLFNVGPTPEGEIEPRQAERPKEMGAWLAQYGESIYGTRGGPYKPSKWGASTCKGNVVYLHIMKWKGANLVLPPLPHRIVKSTLMTGGGLTVEQTAKTLTVSVPEKDRQEIDTLVKLELDAPALKIKPIDTKVVSLSTGKQATASSANKNRAASNVVDGIYETSWTPDGKDAKPWLEIDLGQPERIGSVEMNESAQGFKWVRKFDFQYQDGDTWKTLFTGTTIGDDLETQMPEPVTARKVRLNILAVDARAGIAIGEVHLFEP